MTQAGYGQAHLDQLTLFVGGKGQRFANIEVLQFVGFAFAMDDGKHQAVIESGLLEQGRQGIAPLNLQFAPGQSRFGRFGGSVCYGLFWCLGGWLGVCRRRGFSRLGGCGFFRAW